jgi:succinate dehydrogenase / fumarate reductase iron-sulfur subunit
MVEAMEREAFGACTNFRACEAVCPKEISISAIAHMNKDFRKALWSKSGGTGKKS